jgi:hypothetical protein
MKTNFFKALVFFVFLLNYSVLTAQDFVWAKRMGGTSYDEGNSITTDASGNVYTTGYFRGTADFDPSSGIFNLTSAGYEDIFIQKLDASGILLWAKAMGGGTSSDFGYSITTDASGNVYTTGTFEETADFDPSAGTSNLTSAGGLDIFIQKLDASGNLLWAKAMGGTPHDYGYSITTDASGNVYTTGTFFGIVDFDPSSGTTNLTSAGDRDIFIQKLDASGNLLWAKAMGGYSSDEGRSITTDASGNVYTTGFFYVTADFDPSAGTTNLTSASYGDIFIQKLNAFGNFVWAKAMGGTSEDYGRSITTDASGNVYTTGTFRGTADFDPSSGTTNLTSAGNQDIFIQKLDASGNLLWAKAMGGTSVDYGYSITTDASGNVYTTGFFDGTADFDPSAGTTNLTSAGEYDIFIQKLDASGNLLWAKAMGGTSFDQGHSITTDAYGNVYTSGNFYETADFDPSTTGTTNLTSAGANDIFVAKYTQSGLSVSDFSVSGISIYPNPTSGKLQITNYKYRIDNIIVTDLTGKTLKSFSNIPIEQFSNYELDLSHFVNGVYLLSMQTDKEIFTTKIVKE